MTTNREFPQGVREIGLKLVNDNGSQPTGRSFMPDMALLGIKQIFACCNNPKGNTKNRNDENKRRSHLDWGSLPT